MKHIYTLVVLLGLTSPIFAQETCVIAEYPFTGDANNIVSNTYHGSVYGAQLTTDKNGQANKAYVFDGVDDYIGINNQPVINTSNFTITAWINMAGQGGGVKQRNPVFVQRNNVVSSGSSLIALFGEYVDNKVTFLVRNQSSGNLTPITAEGSVLGHNEWHFLAAVKDSSFIKLYVDSNMVDSVPCPTLGAFNTNTDNADIGRHYYNGVAKSFFNGVIDEVKIFDCALNSEEVLDIYGEEEIVKPPLDIADVNPLEFYVYPNPAQSVLNLKNTTSEDMKIQIFTLSGRIVDEYLLHGDLTIDISNLPNSTYFVRASNSKGFKMHKFTKVN